MAFLTRRILAVLWPREPDYGTLDVRSEPERVLLPAREKAADAARAPVRIYLGTELAQHRAERVFVWSIEQVRDRSREYEIYLMKELRGFDRRRWLTGFTNYRFAIPDFAGRGGRAIYNDEDQIYLADPALMFDLDMDAHGYLSVSDNDTSVMLLDCARMAPLWNLDSARTRHKNRLLAAARKAPGLWGKLDGKWNARDEEYQAGSSHLIHYTALHTQPWRPFPGLFAYQDSPEGKVWLDLERSADAAGFQIFSAVSPSSNFRILMDWLHEGGAGLAAGEPPAAYLREELERRPPDAGHEVLHLCLHGHAGADSKDHLSLEALASSHPPPSLPAAILCVDTLEYLPDEDVPWVLAELFKRARRAVVVAVQSRPRDLALGPAGRFSARPRAPEWWARCMQRAAMHYPALYWKLIAHDATTKKITYLREGGRLGRQPVVWVVDYHKPGHSTQSLGLADAIGWPYQVKRLQFRWPAYLARGVARLLGLTEATDAGLAPDSRAMLLPPWPDLVIATGWRPATIARWIRNRSRGRSRVVLLGRKGAALAQGDDILISCRHFKLPAHPRRIETLIPPHRITSAELQQAGHKWQSLFEGAAAPRIGLLVGGTTELHCLDETAATELGRSVAAFAATAGGSVFAVTSRRTGAAATNALKQALGPDAFLHAWRREDPANPFTGILAVPEILVVTGDSESMIAEAVSTGKPVYIYRLPERPAGMRSRVAAWVVGRAHARPRNRRGTVRPQQGLEYLCARLIEKNIVQPPRDLNDLYESLVSAGLARYFNIDDAQGTWQPPPCPDTNVDVAGRVREMLGFSDD